MSAAGLGRRYLDLVERTVRNEVYGESRLENWMRHAAVRLAHPWQTRNWGRVWPARAHTMMSAAQTANLRALVEATLRDQVPGDYLEAGVWRGGACILMRAALAAHGVTDRKVWVADSFEGLPRPDRAYPADRRDRLFSFRELAISEGEVRRNFQAYGLLDEQVVFVKGLFKDTLPRLAAQRFALIRLDADMYGSTTDALTALYDCVSPGGCVVVDDYLTLAGCRRAVHDFLAARGLAPQVEAIDARAVWWRKD